MSDQNAVPDAHAWNPNTWEAKAADSRVSGQPELHSKFQNILGYGVRTCKERRGGRESALPPAFIKSTLMQCQGHKLAGTGEEKTRAR